MVDPAEVAAERPASAWAAFRASAPRPPRAKRVRRRRTDPAVLEAIAYALARLEAEQDWRQKAACRGQGVDAWFREDEAPVEALAAVCASCEVRSDCLRFALALTNDEDVGGFYAGTTPTDRRPLRVAAA